MLSQYVVVLMFIYLSPVKQRVARSLEHVAKEVVMRSMTNGAADCSLPPTTHDVLPHEPALRQAPSAAVLGLQIYQHIQRAKPYIPLLSVVVITTLQVDEIRHLLNATPIGPLVQCDDCWGGGGGGKGW